LLAENETALSMQTIVR